MRLRKFCFVEWVTNDIKYGLIGRPVYFPCLRAHPPYPLIPSRKSEYLRRSTTVKENPIRQWVLKTFPYYAKRNPVRVKGSERYYRHPADVWVDRYIQLKDEGNSDEHVRMIITSEIERERREYEIEQTVQMEQAGDLGVPWASLNQKMRVAAAPAIKHFAREKEKIETLRSEILRGRARALLESRPSQEAGVNEEEEFEDEKLVEKEDLDGVTAETEEDLNYDAPTMRSLKDEDKLDYPDLPPG